MKNLKTFILLFNFVFLSISAQNDKKATVLIDTESSSIKWVGEKITGSQHYGSLTFEKGELIFCKQEQKNNPSLCSGYFTVDMNSISVEDLSGGSKQRLEGHLRSDDFFSVEKHNKSKLTILSSKKIKNGYLVDGSLTIKEITHPIQFELISEAGGFVSNLVFDRSKYDVQYGSGSFFENLGDKLILDDIALSVNLYIKQMNVVD
jgi:polyisoprenoid-binding protein YceI